MKNTIKITIPFSFKGVEHNPSAIIDLDHYDKADFSFAFHQVATENNIDPYSYEYEVLESSPHIFSEPTGLAREFLSGSDFDLVGFQAKAAGKESDVTLHAIAKQFLDIDDLQQHKAIQQALVAAYEAGKESA